MRLEHCFGRWENYAQDVFTAIRGLEKLEVLELINLEFSACVESQLEKCDGIKALLIIPAYVSQVCILIMYYIIILFYYYIFFSLQLPTVS